MNCILHVQGEFARFEGLRVSPAFHLAEIERALQFIRENLQQNQDTCDVRQACADALEAVRALSDRSSR